MGKIAAPLDVILDDGSHKWSHQIISFETLWPHVSTGGVYIVEDTITSYWPESKRNYNDQEVSCVEYFKSLVDDIVLGSKTGEATVHKGYLSYSIVRQLKKLTLIQHTVESIQFLNGMIIVRKREVY
jgi:cephalosporin hydroxylase